MLDLDEPGYGQCCIRVRFLFDLGIESGLGVNTTEVQGGEIWHMYELGKVGQGQAQGSMP